MLCLEVHTSIGDTSGKDLDGRRQSYQQGGRGEVDPRINIKTHGIHMMRSYKVANHCYGEHGVYHT